MTLVWVKIIIFILILVAAISFFYLMKKQDVLANIIREASEALENKSLEKAKEEQINIQQQKDMTHGKLEKALDKPRKRFLYSRLGRLVPGLTFEIWFVIKGIFMVIIYAAVFMFSKSELAGFLSVVAFWAFIFLTEYLLAHHNYKVVDDNLLKFVDLLGNFSVTSGEITGILHKVSFYLPEPLCSVLRECYYDAQTFGDPSAALYSMAAKIENPKFKELIRNLESCISYTANFKAAVESNRRVIIEERRHKKDRHDMANEAIIDMFMIFSLLVVTQVFAELLISESIWTIWTGTTIGKVCLVSLVAILFWFYAVVVKAER